MPAVPYSPELVEITDPQIVYQDYVRPVMMRFQKCAPEVRLAHNRSLSSQRERQRKEALLLYQVKIHPRTREKYSECKALLDQYYHQQCPPDMRYDEWEKKRLHYGPVLRQIQEILNQQNRVEEDRIALVKGKERIYYKAYSKRMQEKAEWLNSHLPEKLTVFGVVQRRQDILNATVLREIISCTMIPRTFTEVTGKDLERHQELRAVMTPAEKALYEVALKEFYRLEGEYFAYAEAAWKRFPNRPVFTITGSEYQPRQRQNLIHGKFEDFDNSILICTQQSLSESMSIDSVDHCFIAELHWNDSNEDLFAEMGFDLSEHQGAVFRGYDCEGRPELYWGQQQIAA